MKMKFLLSAAVLVAGQSLIHAAEVQRVLVMPFTVLNVPDSDQWVGKGVQENIIAEFGRTGTYNPVAFNGQVIVEDNATAARLGRGAQAALAVRGAAQMVGDRLRLTAQLIDSKNGDTIRTASVTGSVSGLLRMEDELAAQLRGVSTTAPDPAVPATIPVSPVATPTPAPSSAPPQIIIIQQQPTSPYPAYDYLGYPNNSYGYSYPFFPVYFSQISFDKQCHFPPGSFNPPHWIHTQTTFSSPSLPLPTNNVSPLPTNNVLPLPTQSHGLVPVFSPNKSNARER